MMDPENKPNNTTETENLSDGKLENISGGKRESLDGMFYCPKENSDYQFEKDDQFEKELTPCFPKSKPW